MRDLACYLLCAALALGGCSPTLHPAGASGGDDTDDLGGAAGDDAGTPSGDLASPAPRDLAGDSRRS